MLLVTPCPNNFQPVSLYDQLFSGIQSIHSIHSIQSALSDPQITKNYNAKGTPYAVQFSQNDPASRIQHCRNPIRRWTLRMLSSFAGRDRPVEKFAYNSCKLSCYRQGSADWGKLAFTSIDAQKTVEYRQMCGTMRAHARIWRY